MSDLPLGWTHATIGDLLLRIEAGKSFRCEARPASLSEWGIIKVSAMTWGAFREEENKAVPAGVVLNPDFEIRAGDILVSRANTEEYVGAPVLVDRCRRHLLLSDKSLRLVPSDRLNSRWLYYLLSSPAVRREISRRATGTKDSMRNISQETLASIHVQVPPLAEQDRIVATLEDHLSRLDAAIVSTLAAARKAVALRRLTLANLVAPDSFESWKKCRLEDVATSVRNGMFVSRPGREPNGIPILRISAVRSLMLDLSDLRYSAKSPEVVQREGYLLQGGDLLFTRYNGNPEYVGSCAVVPENLDPLTYPDKLIRVSPDRSLVDPVYLAMACSAGESRQAIRSAVKTTAGQAGISGGEIKRIPLYLPDLDEQRRRAAEYQENDEAVRHVEENVKAVARRGDYLRRSLLTEVFAGGLVPQDPAEEPASVLLERIRVEQAAQLQARRRPKTATHAAQEGKLL
jgi:type I restriction enzyme, S subunit